MHDNFRFGARFPAGALHDPLPHSRQGSGRYPGLRMRHSAFPSCDSGCVKRRTTTLTVAGAAQDWRFVTAHLFPVYPRRQKVAVAPEAPYYTDWIDRRSAAPYSRCMHADLDTLEAKTRLVAELCRALRLENQSLHTQLRASQQDNKQLTARLDAAKTRLQTLLASLPEEAQ